MTTVRRNLTIDIAWAVFGGICTVIFIFVAQGCFANETVLKGGLYSTNLEECNRTAKNLCESIDCENHYRKAAGRMPRDTPAHCETAPSLPVVGFSNSPKDAGVE